MPMDALFRVHMDVRPVFIVGTRFQKSQVEGAVFLTDLPETIEVAGITTEEHALLRGKDYLQG